MTDYFSKWPEALALKEVNTTDFIKFLKTNVVYRFGVPRRFVYDNGSQFINSRFCAKFKIESVASTAYNPAANGLAEAFNKIIFQFLKKAVSKSIMLAMKIALMRKCVLTGLIDKEASIIMSASQIA